MKFYKFLSEMANPSNEIKNKVYYHGTYKEENAKNILKIGIQPPLIDLKLLNKKGPNLVPVNGKIYLSQTLKNVIPYILGANMAEHLFPENIIKKEGQYGFLFIINGKDLSDIQPDEDCIGRLIYLNYKGDRKKLYKFYGYKMKDLPELSKEDILEIKNSHEGPKWLRDIAEQILTPKQIRKVDDGEYIMWAHAGKKIVKRLSDWQKIELIEKYGVNIAHTGPIMPIEAWRFDKNKSFELKKDGINFFDLAEKIK